MYFDQRVVSLSIAILEGYRHCQRIVLGRQFGTPCEGTRQCYPTCLED
ncbi:hypothetical protein HALLA_17000 [Halostagnicola larsenii XH-48]|uniref:Uncharacterized protein n=1 Tax=Halostagnicola larsenii XH-48 TaxID=797299 RepID=W0JVM0_9EURY|nr:hypothetical protein HALLA_17000 [Halostagnicola larsenii XH-48]